MRLVPRELEIGPEEGFAPEKDIFNRKPFGEQLTRIVCALDGRTVLLLDAQCGTGKTTFIKMWLGELAKSGITPPWPTISCPRRWPMRLAPATLAAAVMRADLAPDPIEPSTRGEGEREP